MSGIGQEVEVEERVRLYFAEGEGGREGEGRRERGDGELVLRMHVQRVLYLIEEVRVMIIWKEGGRGPGWEDLLRLSPRIDGSRSHWFLYFF